MALEWEICITCSHSNTNTPPNICVFIHLQQDTSQTITPEIQFARDSTGVVLSPQEVEDLGWRAEILSYRAELYQWEAYHYAALKELYCQLGFDPSTERFAQLPLTQLGPEFLADVLTDFTNNSLYAKWKDQFDQTRNRL